MEVTLIVERGRTAVTQLVLKRFPTTVGRYRDCRLQITSRHVSRRHCILEEEEGVMTVRDLGSSNGTLVNGEPIDSLTVLKPGDVMEIGPISFRVVYGNSKGLTDFSDQVDDGVQTIAISPEEDEEFLLDKEGEREEKASDEPEEGKPNSDANILDSPQGPQNDQNEEEKTAQSLSALFTSPDDDAATQDNEYKLENGAPDDEEVPLFRPRDDS